MDLAELEDLLCSKSEDEHIEFKEAKNTISVLGDREKKKSVYGYAVAFGNEKGGILILGVNDRKEIVGTAALPNFEQVKSDIYNNLKMRIAMDEIFKDSKRVVVIHFPSRKGGELLKFHGIPLMRVGEQLLEMDDVTQRRILLEQEPDFSAQAVSGLAIDDLDPDALSEMQRLYIERYQQPINIEQLFIDFGLRHSQGFTYAALILLGRPQSLRRYLANSEIIFQYRNNKNVDEYQDREDYRGPFLLEQKRLWNKISARNQITQIQEGFLTKEIFSFNEKVVKEAVLNAVTHRDYRDPGSIVIKQSMQEFEIQSPGGFLPGVNQKNILTQTKPRNRLLAEVLQHLGFVQRAGQGMDTIFRETLREGKNIPDLSASDSYCVNLKISAQVKSIEFIKYIEMVSNEKQVSVSLNDLILLQSIESGHRIDKDSAQRFLNLGIIEKTGKTSGTSYVLSHYYYQSHGKTGNYTRLVGLARDVKKQLILSHLEKNASGAPLSEIAQAFTDMQKSNVANLLQELKKDGKVFSEGSKKLAIWKLVS